MDDPVVETTLDPDSGSWPVTINIP
ncbi:MAG: hypothetical protein ACLSCU_08980 [Eubacterium sp.]